MWPQQAPPTRCEWVHIYGYYTHTHTHCYTYAAHEILSERYIYCFAINLSNKFYFYCSADADCLTDCQLKVGSTVAGEGQRVGGVGGGATKGRTAKLAYLWPRGSRKALPK